MSSNTNMDMNHHDEEDEVGGRQMRDDGAPDVDLPGDPVDPPARRGRARRDSPTLFETDAGILVLSDVSSVQCYASPHGPACQVVLRSGVSIHVDMRYSRGLIEAVKAHYADSSAVRSMLLDPKTRTS